MNSYLCAYDPHLTQISLTKQLCSYSFHRYSDCVMSTAFDPSSQLRHDDDDDDENELFFDARVNFGKEGDDNEDTDYSCSSDVNDIGKDVKANFFVRVKKPKRLVCPFSDPSRVNRCLSHAEAKSRKDVIENHLLKVKSNGGDEQHPLDDPLWNSFDVVWFLTPRPKFTPKERKLAKGSVQSRYYKKRKYKQEREGLEAKRKFEGGIIDEEEYKKYLIGHERRKFITETATEKRVRAEMQSNGGCENGNGDTVAGRTEAPRRC